MLILGIDGGGTKCRARLCSMSGAVLGEGLSGPANIRVDLEGGFAAALDAAAQCLRAEVRRPRDPGSVTACLAFAGAAEPAVLAAAQRHAHPFGRAIITSDGHAACVGAHGGRDGGVVAIGTGVIGWAVMNGVHHRVGGWGFPISDEGSGAWLGCEAIRRALWAHDGRIPWTPMLRAVFEEFGSDPHEIVRWMSSARPGSFAGLAPHVVAHAARHDTAATEIMRMAAAHIDAAAQRLSAHGVARLSVVGGLANSIEPWLASQTRRRLSPPWGDALDGAVRLAGAEADAVAPVR